MIRFAVYNVVRVQEGGLEILRVEVVRAPTCRRKRKGFVVTFLQEIRPSHRVGLHFNAEIDLQLLSNDVGNVRDILSVVAIGEGDVWEPFAVRIPPLCKQNLRLRRVESQGLDAPISAGHTRRHDAFRQIRFVVQGDFQKLFFVYRHRERLPNLQLFEGRVHRNLIHREIPDSSARQGLQVRFQFVVLVDSLQVALRDLNHVDFVRRILAQTSPGVLQNGANDRLQNRLSAMILRVRGELHLIAVTIVSRLQ